MSFSRALDFGQAWAQQTQEAGVSQEGFAGEMKCRGPLRCKEVGDCIVLGIGGWYRAGVYYQLE